MSKRKGTDFSTIISSTVSVGASIPNSDTASGGGGGVSASWEETRQQLKALRDATTIDDLVTSHITSFSQFTLDEEMSQLLTLSKRVKNQLEDRIQMAQEACREESDEFYKMQLTLEQLKADRDALHQAICDLNSTETETKERIAQFKEEASQELESMDQVEADRMRQVPRLKQQISLYATTTGIKWDFDQEDMLAGQIAVPTMGGLRRFCIDPNEYSEFEIANHLWSLMEDNMSAPAIKSG